MSLNINKNIWSVIGLVAWLVDKHIILYNDISREAIKRRIKETLKNFKGEAELELELVSEVDNFIEEHSENILCIRSPLYKNCLIKISLQLIYVCNVVIVNNKGDAIASLLFAPIVERFVLEALREVKFVEKGAKNNSVKMFDILQQMFNIALEEIPVLNMLLRMKNLKNDDFEQLKSTQIEEFKTVLLKERERERMINELD